MGFLSARQAVTICRCRQSSTVIPVISEGRERYSGLNGMLGADIGTLPLSSWSKFIIIIIEENNPSKTVRAGEVRSETQ